MWKKGFAKLKKRIAQRSLMVRIFVLVLLVGVIPSAIHRYSFLSNYEQRSVENRIRTVQNQLLVIGDHLISNDYFSKDRTHLDVIDAELNMVASLYEGRVIIINSALQIVKDTYDIATGKTMISKEIIECLKGKSRSYYARESGYIEIAMPIFGERLQKDQVVGVLLASISNASIVDMADVLNRNALIIEYLMWILIALLAVTASYLLTKPFMSAQKSILAIKDGYSKESIAESDYRETEDVVDAFNEVLQRMRALEESRQEFVANVSHELKTPMTSVKILADSLRGQEGIPEELYQEFLGDISLEIDRENQIINDLLSLVSMERGVAEMAVTPVDINALTERMMKLLRPIAKKMDVELVFESTRSVVAEVDQTKMSQILKNLIENAIKYNREHGRVKVTVDANHQFFTIEVADTGIGMPQDALMHIFERFYRVDKSHSREIGGTGLGLAIVKRAVQLHKGVVSASSTEGEGSVFVVKIPINYVA